MRMRTRGLLGAMLPLVLISVTAVAAPPNVGQVPQRGHVRVGGFLRPMTLDTHEYDNRERMQDSELDYKALQIQYGVTDALYVAVRRGAVSWRPNPDSPEQFDDGAAWGAGIGGAVPVYRAAADELALDIGWDFHYDRGQPDDIVRPGGSFEADVEWWRAGVALYGGYGMFHGFAGLRYSQVDLTYTHGSARGRRRGGFQEADPWGGVIGGGVFWPNGFVLQAEIALGNTSGYEVALMYDFGLPEAWFQ